MSMNDNTPRIGWSTPARVIDIHDGDTLTVEVTRRITVRLKDCWAPETGARCGNRRVTHDERERGQQSRDELDRLLTESREITLFVPTTKDKESIDAAAALTFGRVVGEVWADGINVGDELVRRGFATKEKV